MFCRTPLARALMTVVIVVMCGAGPAGAADEAPILELKVLAGGVGDPAGLFAVLGLERGKPVDELLVRKGIQTLVASGEISWVRVQQKAVDGGVIVEVDLDFLPRLTMLTIDAPSIYWRVWARRWLDIEVGDPVYAERIEAAARRTQRRLVDRGYPDARVEPFLSYQRSNNSVFATVVVRHGKVNRLAGIRVEGLPEDLEVADVLRKQRVGKKIRAALIDKVRDEVESSLRGRGYWEARVADIRAVEDEGGSWMSVLVDPGPAFDLELLAPANMEEEIRKVLPDPAQEDLHADQTDVLTERVLEGMHEAGWPLAEAGVTVESGAVGERLVRLEVDPGQPKRVNDVVFPGASSMRPRELRRTVAVKSGYGSARKPLTRDRLEKDRAALEDHYKRSGFLQVVVDAPRVTTDDEDGLVVEFPVEEGIGWTIDHFRVEGVPAEAMWAVDKDLYQLEVTEAWDPRKLDVLVTRWKRAMADSGYPEADMSTQVETPQPGRVRVVLWAQPGDYVRFGKVVIAGLLETKQSVVERIIDHAGLRTGNPYSPATIVKAQQELYRLGIFKLVAIVPIPGHERRVERSVVVQLEEGLQKSYLLGLGWATEDKIRTTLGWTHLNLGGGAHALSFQTRYSDREFRYQLSLNEPLVPLFRTPGFFAIYQTDEQFAEFDQERRGVWFEIGNRLKAPFRHWVRYEYQVVKPDAPDEILSDLERDQQEIQLSSITPSFEWDYRNDMLNPTSGTLVTLAPEYAFPAFSAEAEFFKIRTAVTHYMAIPKGRLALGLRVGGIWPFGVDPDRPVNLEVPLAVRFFAGGSSSHRAFATDRLGIPGKTIAADGTPIGGNALVLVNMEYLRPIWSALAAVIFVDGGNVWAEPKDVSFNEFRWGVGLGIRYDTPAGPFRLEYGRKLQPREDESDGELYFSFGIAF